MATVDHDKLDAYHRARMEISLAMARFQRRIYDEAKTAIDTEIQRRTVNGEAVVGQGAEIGREATLAALAGYLDDPQPAIEAGAPAVE